MAKLSPETKITLNNLMEQLLEIIDEAKKAEFLLLEEFGETNQTAIALDELTEIAQQANDLYFQRAQYSRNKVRLGHIMSEPRKVPSLEKVQQTVTNSRHRRQELELAFLQLEDFILKLEKANLQQRKQQLEKRLNHCF